MKKNDLDTTLFNSDIASNKDLEIDKIKTTNVNILLNRVKLDQQQETKKKFYFTAVASTGLILFGLVVFS